MNFKEHERAYGNDEFLMTAMYVNIMGKTAETSFQQVNCVIKIGIIKK